MQKAVFEFSIAQVITLNTAPITILPAHTGWCYVFQSATLMRTGPRYLAAGGILQLRIPGQTIQYLGFANNMLTDVSSSATRSAEFRIATVAGFAGDAATQYGSKGVEMFCATGNPTVDGTNTGGPVTLVAWYRMAPTYSENAAGLFAGGARVGHMRNR
jgi:hypothetical protein